MHIGLIPNFWNMVTTMVTPCSQHKKSRQTLFIKNILVVFCVSFINPMLFQGDAFHAHPQIPGLIKIISKIFLIFFKIHDIEILKMVNKMKY